jgi:PBP1b-binding outer membrane lipoprotein LpoB
VQFLASKEERQELREEKADQQLGFTAPETQKSMYREVGADYMLQGSINAIKDEIKGKYVMLYQVNLELIDLESHLKAWIGQKEIKKLVKRSKYKW